MSVKGRHVAGIWWRYLNLPSHRVIQVYYQPTLCYSSYPISGFTDPFVFWDYCLRNKINKLGQCHGLELHSLHIWLLLKENVKTGLLPNTNSLALTKIQCIWAEIGWTKQKFNSIRRCRTAVKVTKFGVGERKKKQEGSFYASGVFQATAIKLTPTLKLNNSDAFLSFYPCVC